MHFYDRIYTSTLISRYSVPQREEGQCGGRVRVHRHRTELYARLLHPLVGGITVGPRRR